MRAGRAFGRGCRWALLAAAWSGQGWAPSSAFQLEPCRRCGGILSPSRGCPSDCKDSDCPLRSRGVSVLQVL